MFSFPLIFQAVLLGFAGNFGVFLKATMADEAASQNKNLQNSPQGNIVVKNEFCAIEFTPGSGELAGITNVPLKDSVLKGKPTFGTPFRIHADFPKEWLLDTNTERESLVHLGPEGLTLKSSNKKTTSEGEQLELIYAGNDFECTLQILLSAASGNSTWTLAVKNTGVTPRDIFVEFPRFNGVQLGSPDSKNMQTVLNQAGWVDEAWKRGGIYGNSGQWSMQWHAVFDPASQSSLGLIVMDPDIRNKRLYLGNPSIAVQYFPPYHLAAQESLALPPVRLMIYQGDWKATARAYAAWYAKAFQHAMPPKWFQESDTIDGQHFKKKKGPKDQPDSRGPFALNSFKELPAAVLQTPIDNIEYAFWSQGSALFGKHTDGDNLVRSDLGGAEAMAEGFDGVRKLGLHSTLYIEGYIVAKESELAKSGKAERWSVMQRDGNIDGPYTNQGFYHMCPGCEEWQDHLVSVVTRVLKECRPDGIRLDSLGFYFLPCYNPAHHHRSPFDYNVWMTQLLTKVHNAAVAIDPNVLLTTEAPVDFYGQWFHGALTQVYSSTVPPMRLALAPYRPVVYAPGGAVWGSLSGLASGRENGGTGAQTGNSNWICAQTPVHETFIGGNVADQDPVANQDPTTNDFTTKVPATSDSTNASDSKIVARRFFDERCEVIVAARVPTQKARWADGVPLSDQRSHFELSTPAGSVLPKKIAVCNIETLDWQGYEPTVRDGNIVVATDSNWLLVVIPRGENRLVSFDPLPSVKPGGGVTMRPTTLAGNVASNVSPDASANASTNVLNDASNRVEVWAPGLEVGEGGNALAQVQLGEAVAIHVPKDALPGWYQVRVRGQNTLGVKRLLHVVAENAPQN
jgi:hypothetical protein